MLAQVAAVLREAVARHRHGARYGGEELAVDAARDGCRGAALLAERMREAIERLEVPRVTGPGGLRVTASLGVASLPASASDRDGLVAAADAALYRAKRAGKNRVEVARPRRRPDRPSEHVPAASVRFRPMGILDDAIREHLDLKRKHGAPEEELQRQEDEALGPARREAAPQPRAGSRKLQSPTASVAPEPGAGEPARTGGRGGARAGRWGTALRRRSADRRRARSRDEPPAEDPVGTRRRWKPRLRW